MTAVQKMAIPEVQRVEPRTHRIGVEPEAGAIQEVTDPMLSQ